MSDGSCPHPEGARGLVSALAASFNRLRNENLREIFTAVFQDLLKPTTGSFLVGI